MALAAFQKKIKPLILPASIILFVAAIVFFVYYNAFYLLKKEAKHGYGEIDAAVFYVAGSSITHKMAIQPAEVYVKNKIKTQIAKVRKHSGGTKFLYLPASALLFAPLTILSYEAAIPVWLVLNAFLYLLAFYLSILLFDKKIYRLRYSLILLFLNFANTTHNAFSTGQVNILIFLLLVLILHCLASRRYNFIAGIALALASIIKIFPLIFGLLFMIKKRKWLALVALIFFLILIFCLSLLFFDLDDYKFFIDNFLLGRFAKGDIGNRQTNTSLHGAMNLYINNHDFSWLPITKKELKKNLATIHTGLTVIILLFISWLLYIRKESNKLIYLLDYSLIMLFVLLFSKGIHGAYNIFIIPLLLLLFKGELLKQWPLWVFGAVCLVLTQAWGILNIPKQSVFLFLRIENVGLLILFVFLLVNKLLKRKKPLVLTDFS